MQDFSLLPDGMTTDEVASAFEELLAEVATDSRLTPIEIASALCELADRQWHTYELLREDLRSAVESWMRSNWSIQSDTYVSDLICAIAHLGLQSLMESVRSALASSPPEDVHRRLQEFWDETNGDVSDPYSGMRDVEP